MSEQKSAPDGFYFSKHGITPDYVTEYDLISAACIAGGLLAEPMERDELIIHLAKWRRLSIQMAMLPGKGAANAG